MLDPFNKGRDRIIALNGLGYLADDKDLLFVFLSNLNISVETIRRESRNNVFLANILDFIAQEEDRLADFCNDRDIAENMVIKACKMLKKDS